MAYENLKVKHIRFSN